MSSCLTRALPEWQHQAHTANQCYRLKLGMMVPNATSLGLILVSPVETI